MKRALILLVLAAGSGWTQIARAPAPVTPLPKPPRMSLQAMKSLEQLFDDALATARPSDPITLVGNTRGLYLEGYGAVFTVEVDLVGTPAPNIVRPTITDEVKVTIHKRKLEQVPILQQTMRDMMKSAARTMDIISPADQIVLSVRLYYRSWENISGLPNNIRMVATRKDALAGMIKVDVE